MHFSAGFWGLFIMQHVDFPVDSSLSLRNCLIKKGAFLFLLKYLNFHITLLYLCFLKYSLWKGVEHPSVFQKIIPCLVSSAKPILLVLQ